MRLRAANSCFLMCSGAIYFSYPRSLIERVVARHGEFQPNPGAIGATGTMAFSTVKLSDLSQDELYAIRIRVHELDHARCFFGSPLGLLTFRCYFVICATLGWLFETCFRPGKLGAEALRCDSFLDWLEQDAIYWVRHKVLSEELTPKTLDAAEFPIPGDRKSRFVEYVDRFALREVVVLARFLDALLRRDETMTFGDFANLANRAFAHLAMRCELSRVPKWTTNHPDCPLFPQQESILSTEEILEYVALQKERLAMIAMGAKDKALSTWQTSFREDPYVAGLSLEAVSRQPPECILVLADAALRTPIDPVIGTNDEMLVEAHHPTWRLRYKYFTLFDARQCPRTGKTQQQRVAEVCETGKRAEFEQRLCRSAVVPQPLVSDITVSDYDHSDIFGTGMVNDRNAHSFADARLDPTMALADVRALFRAGLRAALNGEHNRDAPLLPLYYFDDMCDFNSIRSGDDMFSVVRSHQLTTSTYLMIALLYGGADKPDLPPFGVAFLRRCELATPGVELHNLRRIYMERPICEAVFGRPLTSSLNWWQ